MTPQIDHLGKTSTILRVSTDIYGDSKEIDGKMFIFRVNLGMWPLESFVSEKKGHRWENMNFSTKPRHVTPQIDCLGEMSTVLRVSTHIFGVSKEIDGKMFIFGVNLGMWPLKSIVLEKQALFWGFQQRFIGFLRRDGEKVHFRVNLSMWPLKSIVLEKRALLWGSEHTFMCFLRR